MLWVSVCFLYQNIRSLTKMQKSDLILYLFIECLVQSLPSSNMSSLFNTWSCISKLKSTTHAQSTAVCNWLVCGSSLPGMVWICTAAFAEGCLVLFSCKSSKFSLSSDLTPLLSQLKISSHKEAYSLVIQAKQFHWSGLANKLEYMDY